MKTRTLRQLLLYNYRYIFAYCTIVILGGFFLLWQLGNLPPGLSGQELSVAARHAHFATIIDLPVYPLHSVLQWVSMHLFSINGWSLRLPSVILAALSIFFTYLVMKKWLGKSTALISSAIFISADWFLFIARSGNGSIELSFWLAFALYSFTKLLMRKTIWLLPFTAALAGLLFVPFGPYAAFVLLGGLFGYHVFRGRLKETHLTKKCLAGFMLLVTVACFALATYHNTNFIKTVFGISDIPSIRTLLNNLFNSLTAPIAIFPNHNALFGPSGVFFVRFFEFTTILFGAAMLWKTRINRLNLIVLELGVVLTIVGSLGGDAEGGSLLLVPAAICMTTGIRHLMHRWNRTFPKNPYARTVAYIPLAVVFAFTVLQHYQSYFQLWPTQSATYQSYSPDFELIQTELNRTTKNDRQCQVLSSDADLQVLLISSHLKCSPMFISTLLTQMTTRVIVPPAYDLPNPLPAGTTVRPLTSATKLNNVRWLVIEHPRT